MEENSSGVLQASYLKVCEELDLVGDTAAALAVLKGLEAQQQVVAVGRRRKMGLPLDDEVVVGNLVARKVVAGMVVLYNVRSCWQLHRDGHTLLGIWGVVSLRILLRWSSLRWVSSISLIVTTILVGRLSLCHRCIQKVLIISTGFDKPLIQLCKVI